MIISRENINVNTISVNSLKFVVINCFYCKLCSYFEQYFCVKRDIILILMHKGNLFLRTFSMVRPDDWHVHCRDEALLAPIVAASAQHFGRALLMPNLQPPLTTVATLNDYRHRIIAVNTIENFTPYMTLYINESVSFDELQFAKADPYILGAKLYPAGATTNSEQGVRSIKALYPLFEVMQTLDLVLQIHGEVNSGDIFEREGLFIEEALLPLTQNFPRLRIVLEHISTQLAVEFIEQSSDYIAATITPHHLFYNRNDLLAGGVKPHYYCLPILKHEQDQRALCKAAVGGNHKFFAGTDSAPHVLSQKESACGCAGIFSAPFAVSMYAQVFAEMGKLDKLEAFMSRNGADFYQLPVNQGQIELIEKSQLIPLVLDYGVAKIVPIGAGTQLQWSVHE